MFDNLREFMDGALERLDVSGIDCIVHRDYQEIFRHTAGYADMENKVPIAPGTLFNVYSAGKVIVCLAAMQLFERGLFLLSDPLYSYMPEYRDMLVKSGVFVINPARNHIRIIDLFTMTAGFSYEANTPELQKLMQDSQGDFSTRDFALALAKEPLLFEPGTRWHYGFCHDVLGALIEVVSGRTLGEYLQENIFGPLGMEDSFFSLPSEKSNRLAPQYAYDSDTQSVSRIESKGLLSFGTRFESGGGGLIMSSEDYMRFADALVCGGIGANGVRIISEPSIRIMSTNHLSGRCLDEDFREMSPNAGHGYGMGVGVIYNPAASYTLAPEGSFTWGGLGGVQNLFDTKNRLSYYVAQHTVRSPKHLLNPHMVNILYASLH